MIYVVSGGHPKQNTDGNFFSCEFEVIMRTFCAAWRVLLQHEGGGMMMVALWWRRHKGGALLPPMALIVICKTLIGVHLRCSQDQYLSHDDEAPAHILSLNYCVEIKPSLQVQLKSKSGFVFRQHNFWGNGQYFNPFEKQSMQNTKRVCCAALGQCEGIFFKFEISN